VQRTVSSALGGILSFAINEMDHRPSDGFPSFQAGKRVALGVIAEHDADEQTILFTLNRPLPGEPGKDYFRYGGLAIMGDHGVKDPLVKKCDSLPVRYFLENFVDRSHELQVVKFALRWAEVQYTSLTDYDDVVDLFASAFGTALDIRDDDETILIVKTLVNSK
jgi:hypothetical protein